jgi:hypothetical protein
MVCSSADAGQGVADQQVDDSGTAEGGLQQDEPGWVVLDPADDGGTGAQGM